MNLHILSTSASIPYGHGKEYTENVINRLAGYNRSERYFQEVYFYTNRLSPNISLDSRITIRELGCQMNLDKSYYVGKFKYFWRIIYGLRRISYYKKLYDLMIKHHEYQDKVYFVEFEYFSLFLSRRVRKLRPFITLHTMDFGRNDYSLLETAYKRLSARMNRITIRDAEKVIVHGDYIAETFRRSYPSYSEKLVVAHYGVDEKIVPLSKGDSRCYLRDNYFVDLIGKEVFLIFGLVRQNKGILEFLDKASSHSKQQLFLIVGKSYDLSEQMVKSFVDKHENVVWINQYINDEDIKYFFSAADWLVLPYLRNMNSQSGPLKLAVSFELPILASKYGEIGYFTQKFQVGITFDPYEKGSVEDMLTGLASVNRRELVDSIKSVKSKMNWSNMAHSVWEALTEGAN